MGPVTGTIFVYRTGRGRGVAIRLRLSSLLHTLQIYLGACVSRAALVTARAIPRQKQKWEKENPPQHGNSPKCEADHVISAVNRHVIGLNPFNVSMLHMYVLR